MAETAGAGAAHELVQTGAAAATGGQILIEGHGTLKNAYKLVKTSHITWSM